MSEAVNVREGEATAAVRIGDVRAWLIEEVWSGHVHYVSRDYDQVKLATEWRQNEWRRSWGGPSRNTVPIVTKNIVEARTFPTREAAETWLAFQPRWMRSGQYEAREHMWPRAAQSQEP